VRPLAFVREGQPELAQHRIQFIRRSRSRRVVRRAC
jgi:hypothetical protein